MQTYVHVIVCGKHAENLYYMCISRASGVLVACTCMYHPLKFIFMYVRLELQEFVGFILILYITY